METAETTLGKLAKLKNRLCDNKDYKSLSMLRDIEKDIDRVIKLLNSIKL